MAVGVPAFESAVLSAQTGSHVDNRVMVNPVGAVKAGHVPRTHELPLGDTNISYVFVPGRVHDTVHVPGEVVAATEPLGYDHVIPVPTRELPPESVIVGIGQHPLLFSVVFVSFVYFVLVDGHALI